MQPREVFMTGANRKRLTVLLASLLIVPWAALFAQDERVGWPLIRALQVSPDGKRAATGDSFGVMHLWDLKTSNAETESTLDGSPGQALYCYAFARDCKTAIV